MKFNFSWCKYLLFFCLPFVPFFHSISAYVRSEIMASLWFVCHIFVFFFSFSLRWDWIMYYINTDDKLRSAQMRKIDRTRLLFKTKRFVMPLTYSHFKSWKKCQCWCSNILECGESRIIGMNRFRFLNFRLSSNGRSHFPTRRRSFYQFAMKNLYFTT